MTLAPPAAVRSGHSGPGPRGEPRFRADIDGLRALAILLVVGYHADVPGVSGGFVGVDVFFVISGYLITRNLIVESQGTGRVALLSFWCRRIRRLVPAMATMVVATLLAAAVVLPVIDLDAVGRHGIWSSLYLSNVHFARQLGDYFGGDVRESPFLHTWSLGVEEQFYLVWPLVVGAVALVTRRSRRFLRPTLGGAFAVVFVGSLALSLRLTDRLDPWAFYGLHSRAWEFAAAGLLAVLTVPRVFEHPVVRRLAAFAGLALILAAVVLLDGTTPYPGRWALVPVAGTVLLILAGTPFTGATPGVVGRTLESGPAQWLGRLSYSWYLWHWPFIVLLCEAVGNDRVAVKVVAAGLALGVSVIGFRFVENPVRFSPALLGSWRRTVAMGAAVTVVAVAIGLGLSPVADALRATSLDQVLAAAADDRGDFHCESEPTSPSGIAYCLAGDPEGEVTAMLVGDSHARHWSIALHEAAAAEGVRLVGRWRGACPSVEVRLRPGAGGMATVEACEEYRSDTRALIEELQPEIVITSNASFYEDSVQSDEGDELPETERAALFEARYREWFEWLDGRGVRMGWIRDNPHLAPDPIECVAERRDIEACRPTVESAMASGAAFRAVEDEVAADFPAIETMTTADVICGATHCEIFQDGYLIYQDGGHLTEDFTRSMEPRLRQLLRSLRP